MGPSENTKNRHRLQLACANNKVIAPSSGRPSKGRKHGNVSKSISSTSETLPSAWSKFRVVLSKSRPVNSEVISEIAPADICSSNPRHGDRHNHGCACSSDRVDWMIRQPHRVNAAVFDPFNQTTLPEAHESFRVINFYMSYAQSSPATTSVILSALREPTCLYAMLSYVSVIMDRLKVMEDTSNFVTYYSGKSLTHIRSELSSNQEALESCVQAIMWLSATALLQGNHNVSRIHLAGIKALLHGKSLDARPREVVEAIIFCDYFCSISTLELPLFTNQLTNLCQPVPQSGPDDVAVRFSSRAAIEQFDGNSSYLMEDFISCAHVWLNACSTWDQNPRLRDMLSSSCQLTQRILHRALNLQPQCQDHYTVCIMLLLGCILLPVPISGIGLFGKGFRPVFSKGIFPTFTTQALEKSAVGMGRVKEALQLWNDTITFFREARREIEDLEVFIFKLTSPVRILAGDKYSKFPRFLETYLRQQSGYRVNIAATVSNESSFRLREGLFGSAYARYPVLDIL